MVDFAFYVLWILAFSALQVISWSLGEIKRLKETMYTVNAVRPSEEERLKNSKAHENWLQIYEAAFDSAKFELLRFGLTRRGLFTSFNPLLLGFRIKKMREPIDKILAERRVFLVSNRWKSFEYLYPSSATECDPFAWEIRKSSDKLPENVTNSLFCASEFIGLNDDPGKQIVYVLACIFGVCVDPFFLYIPFLSHTKMCLGTNTELWKVAVALRTVADFFTALILLPQLIRCMSSIKLSWCMPSIKLILLMCVKFLVLAPISQILFSEKCILKTLGGYRFWNLILLCHYGARLVLIYQWCEQLKKRVSGRTLGRFNAPVYLFLYFSVSHLIGASWYYLSIKRQLSCWNYACKIDTGCIFHCAGTTTSTLNSTLVNEFCPINPPNAAVFDYGIYLDALQSRIVEEEGVLKKFLQCFFWGLRNLSSFASNLHTSMNDGETFFAIIISAVALILLLNIIGNIQRYSELESAISERIVDKMKDDEDGNLTMRDLGFDFPIESRSVNSATERVDSSSRTEEGSSVQRTEGGTSVQRTEENEEV